MSSFDSSQIKNNDVTQDQYPAAFSRDMIGTDFLIRVPRPEHASKKNNAYLEFKCHKFILSARCEFFRSMFNHEMKESANNTVDLPDIQVKTLKNLLKYFYTDTINEVDLELLKIADQYLLKDLKDYCESVLSKSVQVQDAAKIFVLARSITASKLANACLDVITANYKEAKTSPGWKEHCEEDLHQMLAETFAAKERVGKGTSTHFGGLVLIGAVPEPAFNWPDV